MTLVSEKAPKFQDLLFLHNMFICTCFGAMSLKSLCYKHNGKTKVLEAYNPQTESDKVRIKTPILRSLLRFHQVFEFFLKNVDDDIMVNNAICQSLLSHKPVYNGGFPNFELLLLVHNSTYRAQILCGYCKRYNLLSKQNLESASYLFLFWIYQPLYTSSLVAIL